MFEQIKHNVKNILGWKTNRKIVVFAVDDYGNVRVDSKSARNAMTKAGLKIHSRFDAFDSLENEEDLQMLYEALSSVKDQHGNHAVFTALSLPANIDFEKLREENYNSYQYELLPETFKKLKGYERVWDLWKEGISKRFLFPQFHGREHLNIKVLNEHLKQKDNETLISLQNRSYTSISSRPYQNISYTAAFDFEDEQDFHLQKEIIEDGLIQFEKVFGIKSQCFNPPGGRESEKIHQTLHNNGIKYIETPLLKREHLGRGRYKRKLYYTGKKNLFGQYFMVRNCVFEPTHEANRDWVGSCLTQIEASFRWKKPANISSHRVNFCGHIDPANRLLGISELKKLLKEIVKRWPDVEFMTTLDLAKLIQAEYHQS